MENRWYNILVNKRSGDDYFMKARKYLEISLQHREEVEKAIKFNKENNYEYIITDDNNLIEYSNLAYLLRVGYEMGIYADKLTLIHKNYNNEIEEVKTTDEK